MSLPEARCRVAPCPAKNTNARSSCFTRSGFASLSPEQRQMFSRVACLSVFEFVLVDQQIPHALVIKHRVTQLRPRLVIIDPDDRRPALPVRRNCRRWFFRRSKPAKASCFRKRFYSLPTIHYPLPHSTLVQCPHFFAPIGMAIAHCGHSLVVTGGAGFGSHLFTARTNRKIANATIRKLIIVLMKLP
jgi:hypothetical protein